MIKSDENYQRLQAWVWKMVENGWAPTDSASGPWTHEDNQFAIRTMGWMMVRDPSGKWILMALSKRTEDEIYQNIVTMAGIDPICAKAYNILIAQKFTDD